MLYNKKNNEKGITLIALVVTVVILIILIGITVHNTLGSNGLIGRAKREKQKMLEGEKNINKIKDGIINEMELENIESDYRVLCSVINRTSNKISVSASIFIRDSLKYELLIREKGQKDFIVTDTQNNIIDANACELNANSLKEFTEYELYVKVTDKDKTYNSKVYTVKTKCSGRTYTCTPKLCKEGVDKVCEDCGGSGKIDCSNCEGKGNIVCTQCNGSTINKCTNCDGSGSLSCQHCSGNGGFSSWVGCSDCAGNGFTRPWISCGTCGGRRTY